MRVIAFLGLVVLTSGAVGCGKDRSATSNTGGAGASGASGAAGHGGASGHGGGADGGQFCGQALDCSMPPAGTPVGHYCTLTEGIASACNPCGGDGGCVLTAGISYGDMYTYVTIFNVDVGTVMVYDHSGALVAVLGYSPRYVSCSAGPTDFDPTEANASAFTASSQQQLQQICAGVADGGNDAQGGRD